MIFLNDLFLDLFENINISKNITSVILQTPQFISQKGLVNKELNKINTYKLTIKGNINMFGGLITFTNEFDINKCRSYISFNNHSINVIFNENILTILEYINKIISSKFIIIKVNSYNIDFFNIKCPILKIIDLIQVIQIIKKYSEYFFIIKDSLKSVYIKYRIGQFQNVLNNLYNKLYTIINKGNELTQEQLYKFKVEYQVGEKKTIYYCNAPGNSLEEALNVTTIEVNKYVTSWYQKRPQIQAAFLMCFNS